MKNAASFMFFFAQRPKIGSLTGERHSESGLKVECPCRFRLEAGEACLLCLVRLSRDPAQDVERVWKSPQYSFILTYINAEVDDTIRLIDHINRGARWGRPYWVLVAYCNSKITIRCAHRILKPYFPIQPPEFVLPIGADFEPVFFPNERISDSEEAPTRSKQSQNCDPRFHF